MEQGKLPADAKGNAILKKAKYRSSRVVADQLVVAQVLV